MTRSYLVRWPQMDARWVWILGLAGAVALVVVLAAWRMARAPDAETKSLVARVGRLPWRSKAGLAWALLRDRRVPMWLRALAPALIVYLATPVDIVPDFVPVLGQLDDLVVVVLAAGLFVRFTPRLALEDHIGRLEAAVAPHAGPTT